METAQGLSRLGSGLPLMVDEPQSRERLAEVFARDIGREDNEANAGGHT